MFNLGHIKIRSVSLERAHSFRQRMGVKWSGGPEPPGLSGLRLLSQYRKFQEAGGTQVCGEGGT